MKMFSLLITICCCVVLLSCSISHAAPPPAKPAHTLKTPAPVNKVVAKPVADSPITPEEAINIRVYRSANKAVVNITALASPEEIYFRVMPQSGTGSGAIISKDGYILTNNHVIGTAAMVKVTLFDGSSYPAQVVGADPDNDLAVLKIDPGVKMLTFLSFGDSSKMEVGRRVYAIGNPFGLDLTMTSGIISSIGRTLKTETGRLIKGIIQTDAAINPGNSGGPLLDTQGKLIGITTAIVSRSGQSAGIGFAIPINIVKRIVPELIAHGKVTRPDLGILALQTTDLGLRVLRLAPNGPAAMAGIQAPKLVTYQKGPFVVQSIDPLLADIIMSVDGTRTQSVDDLLSYLEAKKPGQTVTLTILRQGKIVKIPVKLIVSQSS